MQGEFMILSLLLQMGAYHTLDIEQNRKFILTKTEWDSIALERIDMACDPSQNADVAAVIMQEGIAHICLVTSNMTIVRAKIDQIIPRKRKGMVSNHEKVSLKLIEEILIMYCLFINFCYIVLRVCIDFTKVWCKQSFDM